MITNIDMSKLGFAFETNSEVNDLKHVNYFYGKNGTGKSSIVRALIEQYGNEYNIESFAGSASVIFKNEQIEAISLGQENTQAAKEIKRIDKAISTLDADLLPPNAENQNANLYQQCSQAAQAEKDANSKLSRFYQKAAKTLKDEHTLLTGPNYYSPNFQKDIPRAREMTEEEMKSANTILSAQTIDLSDSKAPRLPQLPELSGLKDAVNDILVASVQSRVVIEEFENEPQKQNFAYQGMQIHSRDTGERCAFCGNLLTEARWEELDNYFSNEVEKLQSRINNGLKLIEPALRQVDEAIVLPQSVWQPTLWTSQSSFQASANELRLNIGKYLNILQRSLIEKRDKIFQKVSPVSVEVPQDFSELQATLLDLWQQNVAYNNQLGEKKSSVRRELLRHYVYREIQNGNFDNLRLSHLEAEGTRKSLDQQFLKKEQQKAQLEEQRADEVAKTASEEQAAIEINQLVRNLGDESFSLQPVVRDDGQKGLYQIIGRDNQPRGLSTLSTGELNLVAFLWFRYRLDAIDNNDTRQRVIIFDDPVNSNDDSSQYLIMAEIQALIEKNQLDQFFIFTHNNHFYVQLRPNKPDYSKKCFIHLRRANKTTVNRIASESEDLSSIYEDLWAELKFLYSNGRVMSTWNCMRRILETYGRFNYANKAPIESKYHLSNDIDRVLFTSLLKSLHVNSHVGIDTDLDLSDRNIDSLLSAFYTVFCSLGAFEHFQAYWGGDFPQVRAGNKPA
ncbi:AAA family ATPase [Lacticaseibacillus saniviri]|uniref:AAA family ATPase n=1 Tax=Lacticaseibacillus saniviri TaxID=931533 RepID=UPI001EDCAA7B|nr:AAA family ATPase [Lacticaseibacillus saniviri]MCG4281228.1 AAA family ATPase [Lacticaseibacillus saniviri]